MPSNALSSVRDDGLPALELWGSETTSQHHRAPCSPILIEAIFQSHFHFSRQTSTDMHNHMTANNHLDKAEKRGWCEQTVKGT